MRKLILTVVFAAPILWLLAWFLTPAPEGRCIQLAGCPGFMLGFAITIVVMLLRVPWMFKEAPGSDWPFLIVGVPILLVGLVCVYGECTAVTIGKDCVTLHYIWPKRPRTVPGSLITCIRVKRSLPAPERTVPPEKMRFRMPSDPPPAYQQRLAIDPVPVWGFEFRSGETWYSSVGTTKQLTIDAAQELKRISGGELVSLPVIKVNLSSWLV